MNGITSTDTQSALNTALDICGCCEGLDITTPIEVYNRSGLSKIHYRIGTHAQFKRSMLARISRLQDPTLRAALQHLHTREDDDLAIALLDAWATVADVLTFYQERIANESYLRTATERFSQLHLAKLIGYQPRPGVAANTYLAFTLEEAPGLAGQTIAGAPVQTAIAIGTKVQSIPEPEEQPQIFETVEPIQARTAWNALQPRLRQPQSLRPDLTSLTIAGLSNTIRPGDVLLIVTGAGASDRAVKRVVRVVPQPAPLPDPLQPNLPVPPPTTRLYLVAGEVPLPPYAQPELPPAQPGTIAANAVLQDTLIRQEIIGKAWNLEDLTAIAASRSWSLERLAADVKRQLRHTSAPASTGVFVLRQTASLFGYNAPRYDTLPANQRRGEVVTLPNPNPNIISNTISNINATIRANINAEIGAATTGGAAFIPVFVPPVYPTSWEGKTLATEAGSTSQIDLNTTYPGIVEGSWLVLERPGKPENPAKLQTVYTVNAIAETTRTDYTLNAKVSRLTLSSSQNFAQYTLRETTVLAQSEVLELADLPIPDPVAGTRIVLDGPYFGLRSGQTLILTGERVDLAGVKTSELLTLDRAMLEGGYTMLILKQTLQHAYIRSTVTLNGNVARSTHGETKHEVLGSGDGGQAYQRFALRQPPLTYISATNASGAESTLQVWVNQVRWHEVPTLFGQGASDRVYVTRTDNDGNTIVQFGDGRTGARLPTGQENVTATYRKGIGAAGLVKAGQLSLLMTRPAGVRGVTNPLGAEGAADRETLDEIRRNAPLTILTLDRIVSLQDYEDFARAYAGIAKALATWFWNGHRRSVLLTVAGTNGAEVKPGDVLYENLLASMVKAADPTALVQITSYRKAFFKLAASVTKAPDYQTKDVQQAIERSLRSTFSFDARQFGQAVTLSEVIATMQNVPGVVAVNLTKLYRSLDSPAASPPAYLLAALPETSSTSVLAAELLTLDPSPLTEVVILP